MTTETGKIIEAQRKVVQEQGNLAIQEIQNIANQIGMKEIANRLKDVNEQLLSDNFHVIMVGRFSNGKSTFMNALLGGSTQAVEGLPEGKGILPVDDLPTTAVLTSIRYADTPSVRVWKNNGKSESLKFSQFLTRSIVIDNKEEHKKTFENIRQYELGLPVELCRSGITLIDSPGTDDEGFRTEITRDAVLDCDAAIVVYKTAALAGDEERKFVSKVLSGGTKVFWVINVEDGKELNERFKGFVWNRTVGSDVGGSVYNGQDFNLSDIFFVNALQAEQGRVNGDQTKLIQSGLLEFEKRLGEFLINERYKAHLEKPVKEAESHINTMEEQINQRELAFNQDMKALELRYEASKPKLEAIQRRRNRLPGTIERHKRSCQSELKVSFENMLNQFRKDLPEEVKKEENELESLKGIINIAKAPFVGEQVAEEAQKVFERLWLERCRCWANDNDFLDGVVQIQQPIINRMVEEISEEVAAIGQEYYEIHLKISGVTMDIEAPGGTTGTWDRVISTIAAIAILNPAFAAASGMAGWRGLAGALGGYFLVGFATLFMTGGAITFPVLILAGTIGALFGAWAGPLSTLKSRVWCSVFEAVDKEMPKWRKSYAETIEEQTAIAFAKTQQKILAEVDSTMKLEEQSIQQIIDDNKMSQQEKDKSLLMLKQSKAQIKVQKKIIKDVLIKVQQVG